ncbi:MAG: hypothetical protein CL847_07435 [Crocinitomicaceae bacterium]|nr:hypothetical protein [Crocinitomicaceae bacterium]|tara:strand:+ start:6328 stop:7875 length:1548 start_codon:yes stop_codon:yes gene_type:complete
MRKFLLFISAISAICIIGCEDREPLSWESDIFLPLVDEKISWLDFVEDTLDIEVGVDGPATIVWHQPIDMIAGNLAPILPDTSLEENIGIGNIPVQIPVPTEYPFIVQEEELPITNLGGSSGAYLREVVVSSGEMVFAVESTIEGELEMSYYLTCCTIDGDTVGIDLVIPPAVDGELGVATGSMSLENAFFDLTGTSGVGNNLITTFFSAQGSPNSEEIFYADSDDNIKVTVQFKDFEVQSALGYFGNLQAGFSAEEILDDTIPLPNPILNMEGAKATLLLQNTIGADLRFNFDTLAIDGQQLQHPSFFGIHDMARAQWINGELYSATELELDLTEDGSNLVTLVELIPENFKTVGNIELNPYGDISLGNDYLDVGQTPNLELLLEIPLNVGFEGIVLDDSYVLDPSSDFPEFDGQLLIDMWSTFPVSVDATFEYVSNNEEGTTVYGDLALNSGKLLLDQPAHGFMELQVDKGIVDPGGTINVTVYLETKDAVEFDGTEDIRVQVRAKGTYLIEE